MKKLFTLFLALVATTALWAYGFQVDSICYNITSDTTVEVTSSVASPWNETNYPNLTIANIPETVIYNGSTYSVTSIGNSAFLRCFSLTSVTIPNSVTSIGNSAFRYCSSLTSPVYNAHCFAYMPSLYEGAYTIPDGIKQIVGSAFEGCSSLTSITIPNSVTSIGSSAFSGCSGLTKTNYTGDIAGWCDIKFGGYSSNPISYSHNFYINDQEIKDLVIPNTVDSIHDYAFEGCSSLTSITIPNSVTSIGDDAFHNCQSLTSITIPNSVTSIGSSAFSGCSSLTSITIPESVTSIGYSFHGCSSLTTVVWNAHNAQGGANDGPFRNCPIASFTFGEEVKHIPYRLCSGLTLLTSVTIPNSVTSIGNDAFENCYFTKDHFINNSSLDAEANNYWGAIVGDIEIDGMLIRNDTVIYCRSYVTSVTIPNSVTTIGSSAFYNCSSLTSVTIPNSVTSIGNYAFYNCSSLTSVTIPNNVTSIGNYAFGYCSSLTSITSLAETPPTISSNTFNEVNKSIPVDVPCGKVSTYKSAQYWKLFTNIQKLNADYSIIVSTQNSKMGSAKVDYNNACDGNQISATANYGYHFTQWSDGNTDNPRTLVLTQDTVLTAEFALTTNGQCGKNLYWDYNESTQSLSITGSGDMYNNRPWGLFTADMKEAVLPHGITHIGDDAFTDCVNLKEITIPASVTSIGVNSFAGCRYLRNVNCYPLLPPYAESTSFANYNVNLNVPCDYLEDYQYDIVFGSFKYIQCIGADSDNADTVVVTPGSTDVTITWPTKDNAYTYTIVIKKNGETVCTLTFNLYGQLINIKFAPGRNGYHSAQYAEQMNNAYRFTVTGLEEGTQYTYSVETKDETESTIDTQTGEFTTSSKTPTSLSDTHYPLSNTQKLLRDGQLIILKDGEEYNAQGVRL